MNKELEIRAGIHILERIKLHNTTYSEMPSIYIIEERLLDLRRDLRNCQESTINQARAAIRWAESNRWDALIKTTAANKLDFLEIESSQEPVWERIEREKAQREWKPSD